MTPDFEVVEVIGEARIETAPLPSWALASDKQANFIKTLAGERDPVSRANGIGPICAKKY